MNRFQNDFLIRYRKCNVSLCRCQTLASKSPKRANKLGCIREKFGKWPPRNIKFYSQKASKNALYMKTCIFSGFIIETRMQIGWNSHI